MGVDFLIVGFPVPVLEVVVAEEEDAVVGGRMGGRLVAVSNWEVRDGGGALETFPPMFRWTTGPWAKAARSTASTSACDTGACVATR